MVQTISKPERWGLRLGVVCVVVLGCAGAWGQYQPPPPPLTTKPCVPTKKEPCTAAPAVRIPAAAAPSTAEQFPFPGDSPAAKAGTDAAKPATGSGGGGSTADKFPFPGEAETPSSSSSSSSSASSSSSSSSSSPDAVPESPVDPEQPALKDVGSSALTRSQRRHLPKVEDLDHREEEDLQVSHFYFTTGDYQASYLRAQDAVKIMPDDPAAHFALAQAAQRLRKNDEAIAEFGAYLKLDPGGDKVKPALKALNQLAGK